MTIQLTITRSKMTIQSTILTNDYTIDYVHSQMTIQLTKYIVK